MYVYLQLNRADSWVKIKETILREKRGSRRERERGGGGGGRRGRHKEKEEEKTE